MFLISLTLFTAINMEVSFYISNKGESGWVDNLVFTNDKYIILLEEIKMILDTPQGTVLGCEGMDGDVEKFLFMKYVDTRDVSAKVQQQISMYSLMASEFHIKVDAMMTDGDNSKICILDIYISHLSTPDSVSRMRAMFS